MDHVKVSKNLLFASLAPLRADDFNTVEHARYPFIAASVLPVAPTHSSPHISACDCFDLKICARMLPQLSFFDAGSPESLNILRF